MSTGLPPIKQVGRSYTKDEALELDASDSLHHLRSEFIIPSKDDLKRKTLSGKGRMAIMNMQVSNLRFVS